MNLLMQAGAVSNDLNYSCWNHTVFGQAVDERGQAAIDFAKANSNASSLFQYNTGTIEITLNGHSFSAEEPEAAFPGLRGMNVLIEATTLGFVEILLCLKAFKQLQCSAVSLLYVEPGDYFRPQQSKIVLRRDFELTEEVEEFSAVPGNVVLIRPDRSTKVLLFMGFEGQRMYRFLEQTGISPSSCYFAFGVPAFHPGWEMNSFANTFNVLPGQEMAGKIYFCGAQNPLSAYQTIDRINTACGQNERLIVAPIGTKPHGIGTALFACEHPEIGVVYDNPIRKDARSKGVGTWHLFNINF